MKFIQKISAIFIAIVLLLSVSGFSINRMVCLKSGKTTISMVPLKNCCKSSDQTTVQSTCCNISNSSLNLDDFSASLKTDIPQADADLIPLFYTNTVSVKASNSTTELVFNNLPPPRYGRQLLSFISILLI